LLERFRLLGERPGAAGSGLALLVVALEGFGAIKDAHGHDISDALLRIVAARLVRALRCDDLVSRLGGDEFACLLSDMPNRDMLSHLACKLFDSVAAPISIGSLQFTVRPSLGIAVCPDDADDAPTLLDCAKAASQRARRQCSGYAFHDPIATLAANPGARTAHLRQAQQGQR
jgi:diguanylate cyclase (GGDEF)-like protein